MNKPKEDLGKTKKWVSSKLMYISAVIVGLFGLAYVINHVLLFKDTLSQYVAQGYPSADVLDYLIPTQLLPGLFETIAVYGGIAVILIAAGIINQNLASCYALLSKDEKPECAEIEESILNEDESAGNINETIFEEIKPTNENDIKAEDLTPTNENNIEVEDIKPPEEQK